MKKANVCVLIAMSVGLQCAMAQKKEFKETIKKEVSFEARNEENSLVLKNIFGSITVEGYDGSSVQLVADKTITAKNDADLERGKQELQLKIVQKDDTIWIYPDAPYIEFKEGHLKYNWCNNNEEPVYDHTLNITLRVPKNIKLEVSTVNNGEIVVSDMRGSYINANNVNGGIDLNNITGQTNVRCINGAVNISYADNPNASSTYYSLNGDIHLTYQQDLSADIAFKSMNGELFTDFEITKQFVKTTKDKGGQGTKATYRYESKPVVQIGKGGLSFDFETLNGDVIIKKI